MTGLLLVNLGSPDAPTPAAVRRYLRQFLSDPRVVDINALARWVLLHLVILPLRPRRSAAAYASIWTARGSPLLYHSQDLAAAVRGRLPGWAVELGMRYGNPSIEDALGRLIAAGVERIVVFPLYPQYAAASTGSSIEEVFRVLGRRWVMPAVSIVEPFFDHPGFLRAWVARGAPLLASSAPDHVLFSFHGLPERQVRRAAPPGSICLMRADCCDEFGPTNRHCYRAQCFRTARLLAGQLGIPEDRCSVGFQSRLGRTPWIGPATESLIAELARRGRRRLLVFCPAFVADCLETLEEVGIRGRQLFRASGGEELTLVPSLNAEREWVDAVIELIGRQAERFAPPPLATNH
ncbi:MAG: ferrochelatase [Myxococcales bacterium]|nr:ferrochelatase [Myxococcota bacterium]MDW8282055.1 ferrochelatase [Myxococcales bacterium]